MVYSRVPRLIFHEEKTGHGVLFIGENIEKVVFIVINDLSDGKDIEKLINVHIVVFLQIHPKSIDQRSHCENVLVLVANEEGWLHREWFREFVDLLCFFRVEI